MLSPFRLLVGEQGLHALASGTGACGMITVKQTSRRSSPLRFIMRLTLALALSLAAANSSTDPAHVFRGYTQQSAATEAQWEKKFRDLPDRDRLRENNIPGDL